MRASVYSTLLAYVVSETVRVCSDLWLSLWATPPDEADGWYPKDPPPFGKDLNDYFLWIYVIFGLGYSLLTLVRNSTVAAASTGMISNAGAHVVISTLFTIACVCSHDVRRWHVRRPRAPPGAVDQHSARSHRLL